MNHTNNKTSPHSEPDEYEQRILKTGCAKENEELQLCFTEKKDWRICQKELNKFRDCWKSYQDKNNNKKLQET